MEFFATVGSTILFMFWVFMLLAALIGVWAVISDLIRDQSLGGWAKAIWIIALVIFPLVTALVYFIARGRGMAERASRDVQTSREATEDYIRSVASSGPADEITRAKALLDDGVITAEEFEALKRRALDSVAH